jgi:YegS/Rv2252/BmrU family lipid kinase
VPTALFFIHNPRSRQGERAAAVRALQRTIGSRYTWAETTAPGEAALLAREAALNGAETIIAAGGDGTVHEVVCGMMTVPVESRPKLGILPVGTGNDFAFAAGIPLDLSLAFDCVLRAKTMSADVGSIEDDWGTRTFWTNSVGIGFDAKVVVRSRSLRGRIRGKALYLVSALLTLLLDHEVMEVELALDNRRFSEKTMMLTLGNGPREGGGFYTTPNSRIDDGRFEMLLVKPLNRAQMLELLPKILKGSHLNSPSIFHDQFATLRLAAKRPLVVHADGEIFSVPSDNVRKLKIELHRDALRVIR